MRGSTFERVDLTGATLRAVDLVDAQFRGIDLCGVVMSGVELGNVTIDGEIKNLTINGVWIRRAILGGPSPWDPLDLPWDEMPDTPAIPHDRAVRPSLDEVLELRRDRMSTVREVVDNLTDEALNADTEPVEGPGWPQPHSYPVRERLIIILDEEWHHRLFAERDLDALKARTS